MYIQNIKKSVNGYIRIRAEGFFIEKLINTCKNEGLLFENLKREKSTIIEADVLVKNFKDFCKIAKKNKCRVKILKKKGLPFFVKKYRKRKTFVAALVVVVAALIVLSKFVWNIEVIGNTQISSEEILEIVKSEGLDIGKLKSNIDTKRVIDSIRIKRADISWVGIKICGTNAVIEVVEADEIPDVIDSNDYCNIVAKKDAMVVDASAQNGTLQVKEGDVVKKGTVLVAGWMEGKYTGTRYVHATGDVVGKVWYSANKRVYYHQSVEKRTGKLEKKHSLNINNFAINFYKRLSKFEIYDTIGTEKKFKISSNFYLPIKFITKENYELIKEEKVYTKEEAKEIGVNELTNELNQQIQDEKSIINKYISTNENEDYIEVEVIYEVLESIGTEEKIAL